jgi:predicted AlkP superfamily pyrophosphatase or phosphodiesterase
MRRAGTALLVAACAAVLSASSQLRDGADLAATVILISFDGWRWDYHMKAPTPNVRSLMARGVHAERLIPSFPSKTFPNHYTIVTGLYPGHHGVVANNMMDPATGRRFSTSNRREVSDPMWWGGEPLWVTVRRAGQRSGSMFWVGSEAPIRGAYPDYWKPYNEALPGNARVDQILRWLDLPATERPTFLTLYFEDVDTAGHDSGPDSRAVLEAIRKVDGYLGRLLRGLERRQLHDRVNVVVVADHGMAATTNDRVVVLDDYISLGDVDVIDINPTVGLAPKPGREDAVYRALVNAHPRLKIFRRNATPEHWHYRDHPRIPPIVGVADEGWQVLPRATVLQIALRRLLPQRGQHGYDPRESPSMAGLFVAAGPAFKQGVEVPPFENVHIYTALTEILGLTPATNDGDPAVARSLLR